MAVTMSPIMITVVRTVLCAFLVICALTMTSAIGVSLSKHNYNCLLYADLTKHAYGSVSTCNYNIAIATVFCLLYPIAVIVINVICIAKNITIPHQELSFLIHVVADGVAFFFVLVAACTISVGFKLLCDSLVKDTGIPCSSAAVINQHTGKDFFHQNLSAAEAGAWAAVIVWLVQLIGGLFVLWRSGRLTCLPCRPSPSTSTPSPSEDVPEKF